VLPSIGKGGITVVERREIKLLKEVMAMHTAEPPLIRNPNAARGLNISFGNGRKVNSVCKLV
jgi:hypothetical protein